MAENFVVEQVASLVRQMQAIDLEKISLPDWEGTALRLESPRYYIEKIVSLYRKIDVNCLADFTPNMLATLETQVTYDVKNFSDLTSSLSPTAAHAWKSRAQESYTKAFETLLPFVGYSMSSQSQNESSARWKEELNSFLVRAGELEKHLSIQAQEATSIAGNLKEMSAEVGVVKQAIYFKEEAALHAQQAKEWGIKTIYAGFTLGLCAFVSIWLAYVPALKPEGALQGVQIVTSKLLFFAVLTYWLVLCAKNFMAHKHNEVINRHRENALKTFKALADGAINPDSKDIVLTHASQCIFSPQDTGYSKTSGATENSGIKSVIEVVPKMLPKSGSE